MERTYPHELVPVEGPLPDERVERVLAGMGDEGPASHALARRRLAPPELLTGLTLALLSGQPKSAASAAKGGPVAVSGGVWVRERFTVHAPVRLGVPVVISGASLRRFVRKGRLYAVSASETRDASGRILVTNLTTGLERYRADAGAADREEGVPESALVLPEPDAASAESNPALETLRALRPGDRLAGAPVDMSLARLVARDGPKPSNPIHSDPEAARAAGLDVPIAGGAHVLAFAQEAMLEAWGDEALYHGACVDVRWLQPVRAGTTLTSHVRVVDATPRRVDVDFELRADDQRAAAGRVAIPLAGR